MSLFRDGWSWYQDNKNKFYSDTTVVPSASQGKWIQDAIKRPGALTAKAKAAGALTSRGTIKQSWLREAARSGSAQTRRQARLAMTLRGFRK